MVELKNEAKETKCENCNHKKVCGFKGDMNQLSDQISDISKNIKDCFCVQVKCKYFDSNDFTLNNTTLLR